MEAPLNRAISLRNLTCVYCGCEFNNERPATKEHVIGRNFVPWGSIAANDWNLILQCCCRCNNLKSALENEISAVTMQPGLTEPHNDSILAEIARRKAQKVRSSVSGELIKDSISRETIEGSLAPGVSISLDFLAPPQLRHDSVLRLARAQIQAFFYLITYNETTRTGGGLPGDITWLRFARRTDWGSNLFGSFTQATRSWRPRVRGDGAQGNYRIAINRKDVKTDLWSFALEWNKSLRVIGFFGEATASTRVLESLTFDQMFESRPGEKYRPEIPLLTSENDLFECAHLACSGVDSQQECSASDKKLGYSREET